MNLLWIMHFHMSIPGAVLFVCVLSQQDKPHVPFFHIQDTENPFIGARCVLCVSLLKFRLCLITQSHGPLAYL